MKQSINIIKNVVRERIHTNVRGGGALSLLRCMAVANGNNSLDSITLTQSEATRYIVTYQENPAIETYHNWKELREEIYTTIRSYRIDTTSLRRYNSGNSVAQICKRPHKSR